MTLHKVKILTFKQQLFFLFVGVILFFAATMYAAASWISSKKITEIMVASGLELANNAALHSRHALRNQNIDEAIEAADLIMRFPGIRHLVIANSDKSVFYETGEQITAHPLEDTNVEDVDGPRMVNEDEEEWHFIAPIYIKNRQVKQSSGVANNVENPKILLGYVYLSTDKDGMYNTQFDLFKVFAILVFFLGVLSLFTLYDMLKHFLLPLDELTAVMGNALEGELANYAGPEGTHETRQISLAYNRLIDAVAIRDKQISDYNQELEKIIEDRTEQLVQARDEALKANKYKTDFLSNTTHELRTPLQAILGYTEAAREEAAETGSQAIENDLKKIESNGQHLLSLINSILEIARIESGKLEMQPEEIRLEELLGMLISTTQPLIEKNNNTFDINVEPGIEFVYSDRKKLLQILVNLVGNAAKFTKDGRIRLSVSQQDGLLNLVVEDTGMGIEEDKKEKIFEAFQQSDSSIVRGYGGTGLGLTVVKQFCEFLGGSICLDSEPGKGSRFYVSLPVLDRLADQQVV